MSGDGPDSPGPLLTLIIGDGRMRASSVGLGFPDDARGAADDDGFQGMTFAEALRRNGRAARLARTSGAIIQVEDRGGAISLLDIADAFEALTEQSRLRQATTSGPSAEPPDCALRRQLIACIAQGRIY
jgi:hypothetical protein